MRGFCTWVIAALSFSHVWSQAADCNRNGIEDLLDIEEPAPGFHFTLPLLPLPLGPRGLLRASDMDLDGDPDILVFEPNGSMVRMFSNDSGRFSAAALIALREPALDIEAEDIDADGDGDIVAVMSFHVRILWNDGGAFERETVFAVGAGPFIVLVEDIDGDGDLDIISGNLSRLGARNASISVMESLGDGTLIQPRNFGCPLSIEALLAADIDGDGDRDVAAAGGQELAIIENLGSSRFDSAVTLLQLPARVVALTALDVGADGSAEVLGLSALSIVVIDKPPGAATSLRSLGTGIFDPVDAATLTLGHEPDPEVLVSEGGCAGLVVLRPAEGSFLERRVSEGFPPGELTLADFDGDGALDVAVPASPSSGRPHVAFQIPARTSFDCNANAIPDECETDCDGNGIADACDIAARDCNSNGLPDACDPDCNANGLPDDCEITQRIADDCNSNSIPDSCEAEGLDLDRNGRLDPCDLLADPRLDCNGNGVIDSQDIDGRLRFTFESYPAPSDEYNDLVATDLDGDADLDLAAAGQRTLRVLENDADGNFTAKGVRTFPTRITALVAQSQGGVTELVLALSDSACARRARLHVIRSEMPWRFARTEQSHAIDSAIEDLASGDLDGTGEPDLVCSRRWSPVDSSSHIWLVLRRNGVFETPSRLGPGGGEIAIADLNGDGYADVAAASGSVFLGSGDGRFRAAMERLPQSGSRLRARDLDRDGVVDLILASDEIHFLHGKGNGLFEERSAPFPHTFPLLDVLDFNNDGFLDLICDVPASVVSIYLGDGGGLLAWHQSCGLPGSPASIAKLAAGDFDRDGDLDLASAAESSIHIIRNEGDQLVCSQRGATGGDRLLRSGDLDGDGDLDLATAAGRGWNRVIFDENDGNGFFSRREHDEMPGLAQDFLVHDLGGSSLPDICKALSDEVLLFENKGDWEFELLARIPDAKGPVAALDLDGDSDADMVASSTSSSLLLAFANQGSGDFTRGSAQNAQGAIRALHGTDLDGNGMEDIIIGTDVDVLACFRTEAKEFEVTTVFSRHAAASSISSADLDADGDVDLVFASHRECPEKAATCHLLEAALNRGDGTIQSFTTIADKSPLSFDLADVDADGDIDVVAGFFTEIGEFFVFSNNGRGTFHDTLVLQQVNVTGLLAEDVDESGTPDLVFMDDNTELQGIHLYVALNLTPGPFSRDTDHDGVPDECRAARFSRGDANQSGAIDLTDLVFLLDHLFRGGPAPECLSAADAGDDGIVNISDAVLLLLHLFRGAGPLAEPFGACGPDGTPDTLRCSRFAPCE